MSEIKRDNKIKVGITLGDVNGIGPEVIIKAFSDARMLEFCTPVVYGSAKALTYYKKSLEGSDNFQFATIRSADEARAKRINLINCMGDELDVEPGIPASAAGEAAVKALRSAVKDFKDNLINVVVTAPINKENVHSAGFDFTGHTEFFASEFEGVPLMMMCSDLLKVGLVTIHIPLAEVPENISTERIVSALDGLRHSLISDFGIVEPKIAVLALNPHSGDGGLLGKEEETVIKPAVLEANGKGILCFGPFAADGFFASEGYSKYDAVLAMYHDQGLAPFKALTPEGVNFTAGLDVVRTSPDHGVAYDIAGQGVADPSSFREAVFLALDVYRNRERYTEMTKNPLRHYEREKGADISVKDLLPEEEHDS